jgi:hypothetical protein
MEEAARHAAGAASDAARAANHAAASAQAAEETIRELAGEFAPPRGRNLVLLWLACSVSLVLAVLIIARGSKAFGDPPAISTNWGSVGVGIGTEGKERSDPAPFAGNGHVSVVASYQLEDSLVSYDFYVPERYAGRRFVVLLSGTGTLQGVEPSEQLEIGKVTPCRLYHSANESPDWSCQLLSGRLPALDKAWEGLSLGPTICRFDNAKVLSFRVSGHPSLTEKADWAHDIVSLPSLFPSSDVNTNFRTYHGLQLDSTYASPVQDGCRFANPPLLSTFTDASTAPTSTVRETMIWTQDEAIVDTHLVYKDRDAEGSGNIYLATGGAFAAFAIGLLPIASTSSARFARSRRRTAGTT